MKLQVNYTCDICEQTIPLDFEKSFGQKKLECSNCGVVYNFSEEDLAKFNQCYNDLVKKLGEVKKEKIKE